MRVVFALILAATSAQVLCADLVEPDAVQYGHPKRAVLRRQGVPPRTPLPSAGNQRQPDRGGVTPGRGRTGSTEPTSSSPPPLHYGSMGAPSAPSPATFAVPETSALWMLVPLLAVFFWKAKTIRRL